MRRILFLGVVLALAVPATAAAGGWTTVGLTAPPPDDVRAGTTWTAELTVLQHGRTPLEGQKPILTIRSGPRTATFAAAATGRPGVYRARVVFPAAGSWKVSVDHGWGVQHDFGPFAIDGGTVHAGRTGEAGDDGSWLPPLAAVLAGLVAAGAAALALRRRRESVPTP